jgi:lipopolysaccharide/colanic/teichoic acid biosynthesis glycosyltransferase
VNRDFLLTYDNSLLKPERQLSPESPSSQRAIRNVLYVGNNAKSVCLDLTHLRYEGLPLNGAFKAYCYIKEQLEEYQEAPDAIICDEYLPDGDAVTLCDRLKHIPHAAQIPFIVLSKKPSSDGSIRALEAGIDDYYGTDVTAKRLDSRISFLRKYKAEIRSQKTRRASSVGWHTPLGKRLFDILVASTALLILSPILLLITIMIRLDSKGPVFYISKRVGTGYQIFNFFKFRSMRVGADQELSDLMHLNQYSNEPESDDVSPKITEDSCIDCLMGEEPCSPIIVVKGEEMCENQYMRNLKKSEENETTFVKFENDPRVTPLGRFIRKTSLDELPQLFNVLRGDMSIVGNRPLPLYEAEKLTTDQWVKRFLAPAGCTGLWQVTRRGKANMSTSERIELDVTYAQEYSFWYDVKIMLKTLPAMVQKEAV